MAGRKNRGCHDERNVKRQNPAFKKQNRRQNGKSKRFTHGILFSEHYPAENVEEHEQ